MKRLITFIKTTVVLGALSATTYLGASVSDCCDWNWCDCPGDWSVYAEALYWRPTYCPVVYAVVNEPDNPLGVRSIKNDYEWGFRIGVEYENECFLAEVSYLRVRPSDSTKFEPATGFTDDFGVSAARSKISTRYQNVDVRWGQYLMKTCDCRFYVYGNVRWVDLRIHQEGAAIPIPIDIGITTFYRQNPRFCGAGLGVGLGGLFDICGGFGMSGRVGIMGIIGDTRFHEETRNGEGDSFQSNWPTSTHVVPGVEFRIGFNYTYECGCWDLFGEIGYELNYYIDPLQYSRFVEDDQTITGVDCRNFGFGGPYIKLGVGF